MPRKWRFEDRRPTETPREPGTQPCRSRRGPTLLALLGLSPARDMPGRVLVEGLTDPDPERTVATYERAGDLATAAAPGAGATDPNVDPAVLERLRALGYLDTESPQGNRNMAAMLFEAKRYAEAEAAYRKLVAAEPDDGGLRASLAGALASLGRYDEAIADYGTALRLRPRLVSALVARADAYLAKGETGNALADFRSAIALDRDVTADYPRITEKLARLGAVP